MLWLSGIFMAGCKPGRGTNGIGQRDKQELLSLAVAYHEYAGSHGAGPKNVEEFRNFVKQDKRFHDVNEVLDSVAGGTLIVMWGASFFVDSALNGQHVLAYDASTPSNGGIVVMGDGMVRDVTASDFSKLKKLTSDSNGKLITPQERTSLAGLGIAYNFFTMSHGVGPSNLDEFRAFIESNDRFVELLPMLDRVADGRWVFVWRGSIASGDGKRSQQVMAYDAATPESGGAIIKGDGMVEEVSAAVFATLEKIPTIQNPLGPVPK
jgi:hypothetical protein